jgi:hypothetical protein
MPNYTETITRQIYDHYVNGNYIPYDSNDPKFNTPIALHQVLLLTYYVIVFPLMLVCVALLLKYLRRRNIIRQKSEEELLEVLQLQRPIPVSRNVFTSEV